MSPAPLFGSHPGAARPGEQLSLLSDQPDAPFRIHASNRLETLAARLADEMRRHPAEPLEPERIVVPDPLLGQWLRLELASHLGVAAHLKVEQPAEFAWAAMREVLSELDRESVFGPPYLRWRIFDRLKNWSDADEIGRFLSDGDARKRFELADQLAVAYDRCRVYRPDSIRKWQHGAADGWHARLWAELAADDTQPRHWVDAIDRYRRALEGQPATAPKQRVSIFHVAMMSPTYVEMLRHAAEVMDIHLYLLSPSRTFWDAQPERDDRGYYEEHDDLLSAWGRPERDLQTLLQEEQDATMVVDRQTAADIPRRATCLAAVQRDILDCDSSNEADARDPEHPDDSIQIHVCHSATREVEVLHDRLLGIFDAQPDIQPADVLILTPDLDTYAPLVEAVFGSAEKINFSIGRQRLKEGAALTAFLDLLELPGSRYAASDVLAPLLASSVRAHFGIGDADLTTIRDAVAHARIRWGIDGDHPTALDVPACEHHNWRHGLSRLVLGYAMQEGDVLVNKLTPSALGRWDLHTSATDYELLGRFHRYCELVFTLNGWVDAEHTANEWTERLRSGVLDEFFNREPRTGPEAIREVNTVGGLIDEFEEQCKRADAVEPIPFLVLRDVLTEMAAKAVRSAPRLADGVAVADLASGQVIPAKVICAVGMNDRSFPRRPPAAPFDFQTELFDGEARKPGDRDRRDEDRFAFLEALLAARRSFVLTYTGRDLKEDKPIPPSVVVSELTQRLKDRFPGTETGDWATRHPLQPFSPRYFRQDDRDGPALFSYSQSMAAAAVALRGRGDAPERFKGEVARADRQAPTQELELEELIRFAVSPSKHFVRNRLDMVLDTRDEEVDDDEPLDLNALETWQLKSDLAGFGDLDEDRANELATAGGLLPPRKLGRVQHRESAAQVRALLEALAPFREHREASLQEVDVAFGDVRLIGSVKRFLDAKNELLWWRIGRIRAKDKIKAWLRLLALICHREQAATARLRGGNKEVETALLQGPTPAEARSLLTDWIDLWRDGQRRPLPFFASTSWEWTSRKTWSLYVEREWSDKAWSEGKDACHQMIFGDDPCNDEFERRAQSLLGPLRTAEQKDSEP